MKTAKELAEKESGNRTRPHAKRNKTTGGAFKIADKLWALMEPLLP